MRTILLNASFFLQKKPQVLSFLTKKNMSPQQWAKWHLKNSTPLDIVALHVVREFLQVSTLKYFSRPGHALCVLGAKVIIGA